MTSVPPLDTGELYRVLAESASDAIVTIDDESIVLSINPAGEALFGYSAAEL
ncbi:MAG: PAS domain S-box protein, partial [Gemmatimonadota bacterium]